MKKLSFSILIIYILFLSSCDFFIVEQPWATGYYTEKPADLDSIDTYYSSDGDKLVFKWNPANGAQEYVLEYTIGTETVVKEIASSVTQYEIPLAELVAISSDFATSLTWKIHCRNNIGNSDNSRQGVLQPFGTGTATNPWRIVNTTMFMAYRSSGTSPNTSGEYSVIVSDLSLGTFNSTATGLNGIIDGNNREITFYSTGSYALFSSVASGAEVKDLSINATIDGSSVSSGNYYAIFGSQNTGVIKNITVLSGSSIQGNYYPGTLINRNVSGQIINCTVNASVNSDGENYCGGIAGSNDGTISGSTFTGSVLSNGNHYAGGIAGIGSGDIDNCIVNGSVECWGQYVGGIFGYASSGATVDNCIVNASVTGHDDNVGGVAGSTLGTITNCTVNGNVSSTGDNIGGIVGWLSTGPSILDCTITGDVTGSDYVGGITGNNQASRINNCTVASTTRVEGTNIVGGISGHYQAIGMSATGFLTNCTMSATVVGTTDAGLLYGTGSMTNVSGNDTSGGVLNP